MDRIMNNNMPMTANARTKSIFFMILLVTLARFSVDLGFSLKPYMIFLIIMAIFTLSSLYIERLEPFEMMMLAFYFVYSFSGIFALYPAASLRIIVGISLYLLCYFLIKTMLAGNVDKVIDLAIGNVGIVFNVASLGFYFIGLHVVSSGAYDGQVITTFGVMYDHSYPRLVGLLEDPNFFAFYNTIFFAYYLTNWQSGKGKVGLFLCIVTTLLTFSRGGLLAVIVIVLLYLISNNLLKQARVIIALAVSAIVAYLAVSRYAGLDLFQVLFSRMGNIASDGGSGRFELWGRAWDFFNMNIWLGLGPFNFSEYNSFYYNDHLSVHNTFLDILAESGVLGLTAYLLFLILVFVQLLSARVYQTKPYLFYAYIGFILQMASLSVIINDMFFLYIAILSAHLGQQIKVKHQVQVSAFQRRVFHERISDYR